jgi:YegS/Rv2252/BmrU family lipid kinase
MRVGIIINPISGRHGRRTNVAVERREVAERVAKEIGIAAEILITQRAGHAREVAAELVRRGVDRVIAWGGDGTVNEVAGPIISSATALGIVPSGSGDGFARGLRIPRQPDAALRLALTAPPQPIDVGYLGARHFLNIAGAGFDAAVGEVFNRRRKRGALRYVMTALSLVWRYGPRECTLELDQQSLTGEPFLIVLANGREYGNGVIIAPDASFTDGRLDALIVAAGSPFQQFWRARRLVIGRRRSAAGLERRQFTTARLSGEALQCHVDGETFEFSGTLDVRLVPLALNVIRT